MQSQEDEMPERKVDNFEKMKMIYDNTRSYKMGVRSYVRGGKIAIFRCEYNIF